MIKTIFVPMSGTSTDDGVLATALAVARPLGAHMAFYHVRLSTCEAVVRSPHVQFCPGPALGGALAHLQEKEDTVSANARHNFEHFCQSNSIPARTNPTARREMSAELWEEIDQTDSAFVFHARHHDLIVLARPHTRDLVSYNLIETVLRNCGRPVLIGAEGSAPPTLSTIVVGWSENQAAARALGAAIPLLASAERVVIVGIDDDDAMSHAMDQVARQLTWHGIQAQVSFAKPRKSSQVAVQLVDTAKNLGAGLLVVGGYGHLPMREILFGGVTESLIARAELPVFVMH
jgi:nucleotide-binding universal stress UspA family protein